MKKFLSIELIICFMDNTWNTDYIFMPWPKNAVVKDAAVRQWKTEEEARAEQRGSIGSSVAYVGVYNINWDEPVDESGEPID